MSSQIGQLPLNFRAVSSSPLAAMATSPNVQQDSQGNIALNGATANMVGYSVDGISTVNVFQSVAAANPYPSVEGIAELKVTAFNNSVEFSQAGDVTFTTKGGTNDFHGSLFEYLQNDALDATVLNFNEKAPKRFNTFDGSLGGPLSIPKLYDGHNKTFFFVDYEGNRKRTSQAEQFLVPTAADRTGNLNDLGIPANSLVNPITGQTFQNNTIPGPLNSSALTLRNNYYPLPNVTSGGSSYNYENLQPIPSSANGFDTRIDQVINSKQQVYARYNWKNLVSDVANPLLPTPAGAARIGNAGVGILEAPGTVAVNAGLSKGMVIHEGLRLRFEATFTNALNHTNFAPPATNWSSPSTFGVLQSAQTAEYGGNRTGQLALRLGF